MEPYSIYSQKKSGYETKLKAENTREEWCANTRIVLFVITVAVGWWLYKGEAADLLPTLIPGGLFFVVALVHSTILERIAKLQLGLAYFQQGLDRLEGNWVGKGNSSRQHEPPDHVFACDLDLFGTGSLFELLDTTFSRVGESQLAQWLLSVSPVSEIQSRQETVVELSCEINDREALALHGGKQSREADGATLDEWAEGTNGNRLTNLKRMGFWVAIIISLLVGLTFLGLLPKAAYLLWPFGGWALYRYSRTYREEANAALAHVEPDLVALRLLLKVARKHEASSELLRSIDATLFKSQVSAETRLRELSRLITLKDAQRNQLFAPFSFLLLWDPLFTILIEKWRLNYAVNLRSWVQAAAQRDALMALAGFHFENPTFCMPQIVEPDPARPPCFTAEDLGHPFIGPSDRVTNSLTLANEPAVFMLSGSNMSGKSTLLRTIGVNTVLALAGTCACASSLRLTPVHLGATLRVHDSLVDGRSRFYAEIERLAALLSLARGETPLLFLVDEIFHGTNSAARSTGARRLIEEFVQCRSIGIVTTHDLSLADAVATMDPAVQNIHLRDHIVDGELIFDYKLHPGILQEGNALHLMRAVGLPI